MATQQHIYPSKKGIVVYMPLVIFAGVLTLNFFIGSIWNGVLLVVILGVLVIPMILNTNYTITDNLTLRVKCGLFVNMVIDIDSIRKIEYTRSVLSSPALSMDRIEIFYNKFDSVIVSPDKKLEFIAELQSINPAIEINKPAK